jgi:Kef-type K+ transport system membrane component KefB
MAVLLGAHGALASVIAMLVFALIAILFALPPRWLKRDESRILELIRQGAETTGQTAVRLTLLLLVTLYYVAVEFELDAVLGAFAAGFVLRRAIPDGDAILETKLDGLAFGFLIPVFFVTSGMSIDPEAIADEPWVLVLFVLMIMLLRGGPVFISTLTDPQFISGPGRARESLRVGMYASTGLPIIVAVTQLAVDRGEMTSLNASVLVAGGAVTVLVFPLLATLVPQERKQSA